MKYCKLNELCNLTISNKSSVLSKFLKYELTDKLEETIKCCNRLK